MKKFNVFYILPIIALSLLISCQGQGAKSESEETVKPKVRVEEVSLVPVPQLVTFTANVQSDVVNNIAPAMGGRIRNITVDVGANVRKGQTLVTMDKTNYSQQETQLATLQKDYDRYLELYTVGGISRQQLDQAKTQLDIAKSSLGNLGENTTLVSPINGVVTARNYDPGDVAGAMPILTIEQINPVKVIINVSETYYNNVTKGMPAKVTIDALGNEEFTGKVSLIHPTLDASTHTFTVEIQLTNSDQKIRPGMFSRVELNFGTNERPLVTDMAVLKQTGSNDRYVFVEKDGTAIYTLVELGTRIDNKYEIVSGLSTGDRVIVQGNANLIDGTKVEVVQ